MLHKHTLAILAFAAPLVLGSPLTVFKRWEDKCESFVLPVIPENISAVVTKAWYYPTGTLFNESDSYNALVSTKCVNSSLLNSLRLTRRAAQYFCVLPYYAQHHDITCVWIGLRGLVRRRATSEGR